MLLFEAKVKYSKIDEESGKQIVANESYILDAVSFTDAESTMFEKMEELTSGEFSIEAIVKSKISEIHVKDGEVLYKGTIQLITETESGKKKKSKVFILMSADSVADANSKLSKLFEGSMLGWKIIGVIDSNLQDYFKREIEEDED